MADGRQEAGARLLPAMQPGDNVCPSCHLSFEAALFTPVVKRAPIQEVTGSTIDGNSAVCGNHARNVAAESCSRCGMFICQLCTIEADGAILCPACYDRLTNEGALLSTRTRFRDLTGLALTNATLGLVIWFLSFLFGPAAIIYSIRGFRQQRELGETDRRLSLIVALSLGVIETVGGIAGFIYVIGSWNA
jgi:hypothetical protein